ncbi:MAG: S1 RNA-binding domain-containing protein [Lachnospiraceae bacterium]|nr:S1 RNA-binding domain-containing protein [Lachnospiraceae bacterium]
MIEIGKWNTLKVIRSKDFGIYLGEDGSSTAETVLLPRKQVAEGVKAGSVIDVFIYRDSQDRLIATTNKPLITMGEIKKLKVKNVTSIGAFMDWGLEKDILLPFKEQTAKVVEGREYLVKMYSDKSDRLCVSMKLYDSLLPIEGYKEGDAFTGTVYEYKKDMGAFVAIDDKYSGLIHESELFNKVYVGDTVSGRIKKVREDGKADLMLREPAYIQMNEDAEMVYDIIKSYKGVLPFTDKADKDIIKREFGLSKNAFKRAVGKLLKDGRIKITESTIDIID